MESNDSKQGMQPQNAILCKAGCGFYGSASSDGYCSVCFKNKLQRRLLLTDGVSATSSSSSSSNQLSSNSSQEENGEKINNVQTSNEDSNAAPQTVVNTIPSATSEAILDDNSSSPGEVKDCQEDIKDAVFEPLDLRKKHQEEEEAEKVVEDESSKKKNRCTICKKKVGLTGFGCRCGGLFCGLHRYSDTHGCTFDYKEQGQLEIRKNNPKVTFQKVAKI